MSDAQAQEKTEKPKGKGGPKTQPKKPDYSRKTLRKMGREKRAERIVKDAEFRKAWFERKAKASETRKVGWRKRHSKQKA
ncbi:MAG TPA: hypothetical protein VL588_01625 [Bdellovibrionota bacterium]|nr:hypothetical protein [Bdellovibrionota bacterium]